MGKDLLKIPANPPKITQKELHEKLAAAGITIDREKYPFILVGIRGYYEDTYGVKGANDRGVYDDAIIIDAGKVYQTFNGNTDPSRYRNGKGTGENKGMALLKPGAYYAHRLGMHKGSYLALVQAAGEVTVTRDGTPPYDDTGYFGINIHRGGITTTSSEGCQTVPPVYYDRFINKVKELAEKQNKDNPNRVVIPYILLEN